MPPRIDHKKPAAAFALLCVIAAAILGNGMRAHAAESSWMAAVPALLRLPVAHGHLEAPREESPSRSGGTRAVPPRVVTRAVVPERAPRADRAGAHGAPGRAAAAARAGRTAAGADGPARAMVEHLRRTHAFERQSRWQAPDLRLHEAGAGAGERARQQSARLRGHRR